MPCNVYNEGSYACFCRVQRAHPVQIDQDQQEGIQVDKEQAFFKPHQIPVHSQRVKSTGLRTGAV
jgi:hypothetical protein